MALTYWGWDGNRDVVGKYVKPSDKDKNVMPYEMEDFVETQTSGLAALTRMGGNLELIKRMLAAGFPVVASAPRLSPTRVWEKGPTTTSREKGPTTTLR